MTAALGQCDYPAGFSDRAYEIAPDAKTTRVGDSQGMRLGQDVDDLSPGGSDRYSTYDLDAQGSVLGVEDEQGTFDDPDSSGEDSDNKCDYDPYGALQDPEPGNAEADPNAELPDEATDNPFRYQGFYYDSGIQSYSMQAPVPARHRPLPEPGPLRSRRR